MARTKGLKDAGAPDAVREAAGAAAGMLLEQMEALHAATLESLRIWDRSRSNPEANEDTDYYFQAVERLTGISASLCETLAKMKAETRQHISVERLAPPREAASIAVTIRNTRARNCQH
jgi:hypothetical protein